MTDLKTILNGIKLKEIRLVVRKIQNGFLIKTRHYDELTCEDEFDLITTEIFIPNKEYLEMFLKDVTEVISDED